VSYLPSDAKAIPFISEYCDRWCERCAFTSRCSTYACDVAIGMCGDVRQGLELALGTPSSELTVVTITDTFDDPGTSGAHAAAGGAPDVDDGTIRMATPRLDATALGALTFDYILRTCEWLKGNRERLGARDDPILREAIDVVSHDPVLIGAKLHRAEAGRGEAWLGRPGGDHPVQNDWNGSAKVALIALARSEAAWRTIAQAADGNGEPDVLAARSHEIARLALEEFPAAMSFVRPGFDEPGC
jgi:hypothetical protein